MSLLSRETKKERLRREREELLRADLETRTLESLPEADRTQYRAAKRYSSGARDHFLVVDWKSVWYYARLLPSIKKESTK